MSITGYSAGPESESTFNVAIRVEWLIFNVPPIFDPAFAGPNAGTARAIAIPRRALRLKIFLNIICISPFWLLSSYKLA
jgi:hypothetical protein